MVGYQAPVCRPVSFELQAGECLGVTGPNGAGKSTLLSAITTGQHRLSGTVWRRPGVGVAALSQQPERLSECPLTGRDLLRVFQAWNLPVPDLLEGLLDRRLDALSGGQHQLLQVWGRLASRAGLVLLDEPNNHLDPGILAALRDILRDQPRDRGLVLVSHDGSFLEAVCDRVLEVMPAETAA